MKKFFYLLSICLLTGFFILDFGQAQISKCADECRIYFVDRQMHRLIPLPFPPLRTPEKTAREMVCKIIEGKDSNTEILRLFPKIPDSITVHISGNTAYVNLTGSLASQINKNSETERLFVYQLVNSLTSIDGIDYVQFTIDGEVKKDFLGFLDMREIFTTDYDI